LIKQALLLGAFTTGQPGPSGRARHHPFALGHHRHAEASLVDAEKLAIEEINAAGGVLGKKIEVVVEDGASENPVFAEKARKLLERDKVAAIIGCYTSASRKAVLPVLNQAKGLLFYPTYYEGQEQDKRVIYPSQEATQSVIAAVDWMAREKGKSFFLVGSDYIYPRTCNKIAKPTPSPRPAARCGRGIRAAGPHRVLLDHQQDQGRQARLHLQHRGRRLQRGFLQAAARGGAGRRQAGAAVHRGARTRSKASARTTPGLLRLHGLLPEHQVARPTRSS
jgi:hypothetical protein